jgi:tetratricopeptide (TPR) repeat protein
MRYHALFPIAFVVASVVGPAAQPPLSNPDAERARIHYRLGWESLRSESWETAAKEFQQAIDLYPKFALAYYGLGKSQMGLRRYPNAITAFAACRDIYVARAGERFSADMDANRRRQDRLTELQELATQYGKGPQTAQVQDTQRLIQSAISQTKNELDRGFNVVIDSTVPAFISVALGSAYFRAERFPDAEREYKAAIAADPKAGEAHNNVAVVYMLTGRYDAAEREIQAAEESGFRVNPQFKEDLKKAKSKR